MQSLKPGSLLQGGKYKIESTLGQGGFGITYLATQNILYRKVAIKEFFFSEFCERDSDTSHVTLGTQSNRDIVERFLNKFIKEARTISMLHHPDIISIYDIFGENGTAYYVMEYIEGESLSDMVKRRGALPQAEALFYIHQIGNALTYIHQRSINHLDIKPSNIMLRYTDNQIILIDFGVAKQYDEQTKEGTTTTPVGISHGYSPVEQYRKNGVQMFSPQSDVYALAATLFKLLTGNTPPEAPEILDMGVPVEELRQRGVSGQVIQAIVLAMKPRSNRTQSVAEFIANLEGNTQNGSYNKNDSKTVVVSPQKTGASLIQKPKPSSYKSRSKSASKHRSLWTYIIILIGIVYIGGCLWLVKDLFLKEKIDVTESVIKDVTNKPLRITMGYIEEDCIYTGEVDSLGLPHGQGKAFFVDGKRLYTGFFVHGIPNGENAFFKLENGDTYEGAFKDGFFDGKGKYTSTQDEEYFLGTFKRGKIDQGDWYDKSGKKK